MIKLKNEINKSATMRELRKEAEKGYKNSWQSELQVEAFMKGAEAFLKLLRLQSVSNRFYPKQMAEWFHNNYEEIAKAEGWQTQDKCKVEFKDLPKSNRTTMIKVCERWLNGC